MTQTTTRQYSGLTMIEARLPGKFELRSHRHDGLHVCIILDGAFEEEDRGRVTTCRTESVRVSQPGAAHHIAISDTGANCLILELDNSYRFAPSTQKSDHLFFEPGALQPLCTPFRTSANTFDSPLQPRLLACRLIAGAHQVALAGELKPMPDWLLEGLAKIDEGVAVGAILATSSLARSLGVHRVHLSREFLRHVGCSVQDYIRLRRLEFAGRMLLESDASLVEAAAVAGYADQSHLNRSFRQFLGCTPTEYRRRRMNPVLDHVTRIQDSTATRRVA